MINLTFVLRTLKGRCYGNKLILGFLQTSKLTAFSLCSGVPKRSVISPCLHKNVNTGDDAAIFCKNIGNIDVVTFEITFLICVPSYGYWAKIGL